MENVPCCGGRGQSAQDKRGVESSTKDQAGVSALDSWAASVHVPSATIPPLAFIQSNTEFITDSIL